MSTESEFERLCAPELRAVYCYIASRVSMNDAEDVLQETLLSAWKSFGSFDHRASVRTWLISVARRRICDLYRSREGLPEFEDDPELDPESDERLEESSAEKLDVASAIGSLSADERELVTLIFDSGLSYEESAEVVGIPVGTVKSRMSSIRKKLRAKLGEGYHEL